MKTQNITLEFSLLPCILLMTLTMVKADWIRVDQSELLDLS